MTNVYKTHTEANRYRKHKHTTFYVDCASVNRMAYAYV